MVWQDPRGNLYTQLVGSGGSGGDGSEPLPTTRCYVQVSQVGAAQTYRGELIVE